MSTSLNMSAFEAKDSLYKSLSGDLWKPNPKQATGIAKKVFEESISRINHESLKKNPLEHFQFYEAAAALQPNGLGLLIAHNAACTAVSQFGSDQHSQIIKQTEQRKRPLGVCMHEFGNESAPREIGTTAVYDSKTKQFTLDSISPFYRKFWCDGFGEDTCVDYALVFAKTIVDSKTNASEGVNAFLVEIRNPQTGAIPKNITIEDLGENNNSGLPKGSVYFDKVMLPKDSLLDKVTKVNEQGKVESQLKPHYRISAYVDGMTYWHQALSSCAIGLVKAGLFVALRFSRHRWTVSDNNRLTIPLLSNQMHQHAFVPLAARALVYNFAHNLSKQQFLTTPTDSLSIVLANLCKSRTTDFAFSTLTTISSYTGVLGLSVFSRISEYQQAARAYCSEAGDNKLLAVRASYHLVKLQQSGKYQLPKINGPLCVKEVSQLDSVDLLLNLMKLRECTLFEKMVEKFATLRKQARTPHEIYSRFLTVEQLAYANAFFDRVSLEQTVEAARRIKDPTHSDLVLLLARIFAAEVIKNELPLFLIKGVIDGKAAEAVAEWYDSLVKEGSLKVDFLLFMWNVPVEQMNSLIVDHKYGDRVQQEIKTNEAKPRL